VTGMQFERGAVDIADGIWRGLNEGSKGIRCCAACRQQARRSSTMLARCSGRRPERAAYGIHLSRARRDAGGGTVWSVKEDRSGRIVVDRHAEARAVSSRRGPSPDLLAIVSVPACCAEARSER